MKKILSLFLLVGTLLLGCSKNELLISASLSPVLIDKVLDPSKISYSNQFYLLENLTRRLLSIDERGNNKLELASNITKVSDLEYHFKISKAYYSNGEIIKLLHVRDSIRRVWNKGSSQTNFKMILKSVELEGEVLIVKLKYPSKSFLYYLSLPDASILHPSQIEKDVLFASDFVKVSSGPYTYVNEKNNYYLKKNKYFKFIANAPDKVSLVSPFGNNVGQLFMEKKIDVGQVDYETFYNRYDALISHKNFKHLGIPSDALVYICFNKNSKRLSNINVRKFISQSIQDHFRIPKQFEDLARKTNQYFPPESKAYLPNLKVIGSVVKKPNTRLKIAIHTYTTAYKVTIEKLIKQLEQNSEIDIKVFNDIEPANFDKELSSSKFELLLAITATDYRMPVEAINFEYLSPDAKFEDRNNVIRNLYEKYDLTKDPNEEIKILQKISRRMSDNFDFIPLYHSAIPYLVNVDKIDIQGLNHLFVFNFWKLNLN